MAQRRTRAALRAGHQPAIVRGHLDVDTLEVATDGFAEVLAEDTNHGAGEEEDDAALVEKFEEPVVDRRFVELEVLGDVAQQMRHLECDPCHLNQYGEFELAQHRTTFIDYERSL